MGGEGGIPHLWLDNICDGNHLYFLHINGWRMCKSYKHLLCGSVCTYMVYVFCRMFIRLELSIFMTASSDIEHNC